MIKDLERNPPADYPVSKIRPVEWLLRSVEYMEDELMDKGRDGLEAGTGQPLDADRRWGQVTALENYKFHFQRLRMVAKELIMQNYSYGGNISTTSIEVGVHVLYDPWASRRGLWLSHQIKSKGTSRSLAQPNNRRLHRSWSA